MRKKTEISASMPRRKELSDTPIKLCNEISKLFRAHFRENEKHDEVYSYKVQYFRRVLNNWASSNDVVLDWDDLEIQ